MSIRKIDGVVIDAVSVDTIKTGTYTGDGTDDRAVPHGLGVTPKLVLVARYGMTFIIAVDGTKCIKLEGAAAVGTVTGWDSTNFYVENTNTFANGDASDYQFIAFGA